MPRAACRGACFRHGPGPSGTAASVPKGPCPPSPRPMWCTVKQWDNVSCRRADGGIPTLLGPRQGPGPPFVSRPRGMVHGCMSKRKSTLPGHQGLPPEARATVVASIAAAAANLTRSPESTPMAWAVFLQAHRLPLTSHGVGRADTLGTRHSERYAETRAAKQGLPRGASWEEEWVGGKVEGPRISRAPGCPQQATATTGRLRGSVTSSPKVQRSPRAPRISGMLTPGHSPPSGLSVILLSMIFRSSSLFETI